MLRSWELYKIASHHQLPLHRSDLLQRTHKALILYHSIQTLPKSFISLQLFDELSGLIFRHKNLQLQTFSQEKKKQKTKKTQAPRSKKIQYICNHNVSIKVQQ